MNSTTDLIPLSHLVIEGLGESLFGPPSIDTLITQLAARGVEVVLDDVGRRAISKTGARAMFAERAAQQERDRALHAERAQSDPYEDAVRRGRAARAERQRQLLRQSPDLSAAQLMALDGGDHARQMERAGRRHDDYVRAERTGVDGFGRFGRITHPTEE